MAKTFSLLDDVGGPLKHLALQVKPDWTGRQDTKRAYEALIKAFAHAALTVVTDASSRESLCAWLSGLGAGHADVIAIPDEEFKASGVWPRDAMLCALQGKAHTPLHIRPTVSRSGELAHWLSEHLHTPARPLKIALDGGDSLVVGDSHWIVGAGAVAQTIDANGGKLSWDDAVALIAKEVERSPIVAGYRYSDIEGKSRWLRQRYGQHRRQALAPLAMNVGPVARTVATMRASLRAARNTLSDVLTGRLFTDWLHVDMVVSVTGKWRDEMPLVLVASPTMDGCPPSDEATFKNDLLTALGKELTNQGLAVVRNPAPLVEATVLPYNNTIIQTNPNIVWLPVFGNETTDKANIDLWASLEFDVRPIDGWAAFLPYDGSIRCATLHLERAGPPPGAAS